MSEQKPASKDTEGGWSLYAKMVKAELTSPETLDYKKLMQKYIAGVPYGQVVEELNGEGA